MTQTSLTFNALPHGMKQRCVFYAQQLLEAVAARDLEGLVRCLSPDFEKERTIVLCNTAAGATIWRELLLMQAVPFQSTSGLSALAETLGTTPWPEGGRLLWKSVTTELQQVSSRTHFFTPSHFRPSDVLPSEKVRTLLKWGMPEEASQITPTIPLTVTPDIFAPERVVDLENLWLALSASEQAWPEARTLITLTPDNAHVLAHAAASLDKLTICKGLRASPETVWARVEELAPHFTQRWLTRCVEFLTAPQEHHQRNVTNTVIDLEGPGGLLLRSIPSSLLQHFAQEGGTVHIKALTVLVCLYRPAEEAEQWVTWAMKHAGKDAILNPLGRTPAATLFDILGSRGIARAVDYGYRQDSILQPSSEGAPAPVEALKAWWEACRFCEVLRIHPAYGASASRALDGMLACQAPLFQRHGIYHPATTEQDATRHAAHAVAAPHAASTLINTGLSLSSTWWTHASDLDQATLREQAMLWCTLNGSSPQGLREPWRWPSHLRKEGAAPVARADYWKAFLEPLRAPRQTLEERRAEPSFEKSEGGQPSPPAARKRRP